MLVGVHAEIICIGDELLAGGTVETNSAEIGRFLRLRGVSVRRAVSVADSLPAIVGALREADGVELCVITGGLGPTSDDLTSAAVAKAAGVDSRRLAEAVLEVEAALARRGRELDPIQLRQAEVPVGAVLIKNPVGIAPGFALEIGGRWVVALPGVPSEMRAMLDGAADSFAGFAPALTGEGGWSIKPRARRIFRCFGVPEAEIAGLVEPVFAELGLVGSGSGSAGSARAGIHYRASGPEVDLTVDVEALEAADVEVLERRLRGVLGEALYGLGEADLAVRIASCLKAHGLMLATAESCTGGRVAAAMTGIAGVSACFHGGVVAYHNGIKEKILGIPAEVLETHGAVSEPVARGMADGVRAAFDGHADLGVGITGIAGPGGGSEAKPVGTVDISVSDAGASHYRRFLFRGDRSAIQRDATAWALWMVFQRLRERGLSSVDLVD